MCLDQILRLMHPFMPFITEEIWQAIPHEGEALIVASLAEVPTRILCFQAEEDGMESIMQAIRAVRNRRAEMNVPPARRTTLYIVTEKPGSVLCRYPVYHPSGLCRARRRSG